MLRNQTENQYTTRQCLLDSYSLLECPSCHKDVSSATPSSATSGQPKQQVLVTLHNEGGVQEGLDILPLLEEESYLRAYPEERRARAFLEFCREGDLSAVVDMLLRGDDEEDEDEDEDHPAQGEKKPPVDVLRYQDSINEMQSALHAAVAGGSREIAWLLLLLASQLPLEEFPPEVLQEAQAVGLVRSDAATQLADVRSLRDAGGRSAEDLAKENGSVWGDWLGNGRLIL